MGKAELPVYNIFERKEQQYDQFQELPKAKSFNGGLLLNYKGFWCSENVLQAIISFQKHFQSEDGDILLATLPKAGTTWLKALVFSIAHRNHFTVDQSPLLTTNPHVLVPFEFLLNWKCENPDLRNNSPGPLILSTHVPYDALASPIFDCKCKIIYLGRNPLDQFISLWHFLYQNELEEQKANTVNEAFELFLEGKHYFGPFWDQILGYWNASLNYPEKVLFIKYEDLKKDTISGIKKIAEFLGIPFSKEEEKNGLIEQIAKLCSFQSLSNMEVNKDGNLQPWIPVKKSSFFRKGEVGDWANYLSPEMVDRAARLIEEKFGESGLTFEFA